jgi:hypothetical protein
VPRKKKRDCRELADFVAAYGCLPTGFSYGDYVGLVENIRRVQLQRAADVWRGVAAAFSRAALAPEWFDAIARYPEQAESLESDVNTRRREASAMAKGSGPPR